jgi:hypothetical protein
MTRLEIGITHEVKINGDKSWIKLSICDEYEFSDKLGRDLEEAVSDLSEKVNQQLIKVIEKTVETVENYQ